MQKTNGFLLTFLIAVPFLIILNYIHVTKAVSEREGILNSMKNLTAWAIKEETIFKLVNSRHLALKRELQILEEYIEDYKDSTEKAINHAIRPLKNPEERGRMIASSGILSYRMIFRYAKHLIELKEVLIKDDHRSDLEDLLFQYDTVKMSVDNVNVTDEGVSKPAAWPTWTDVNEAMQGFIHVQEMNDLPFGELPAILSPETDASVELNAFHSVQIGIFALHTDHFAIAVEWLEFAAEMVTIKGDNSISSLLVYNYLELALKSHNEAFARIEAYDHAVFAYNVSLNSKGRLKRRNWQIKHFAGMKEANFATINFWELCSGKQLQSAKESSRLHCYYENETHPSWYIGPMKVEVLSEDPPVVQIYDLIGEKMIQEILDRSQSNLSHSGVVGEDSLKAIRKSRTSVNSWINDDDIPQLTKKVEMITGLKVYGNQSSEQLQVVEYVFGRYYAVHMDAIFGRPEALNAEELALGDRVATLLFYLNDVEAGGYTPFANAGTFAPPIKGSAIFWYNLYKNGTMRQDTWHGACPVLYGHKIVANKWIRYNAQFQTYQCSLDSNE